MQTLVYSQYLLSGSSGTAIQLAPDSAPNRDVMAFGSLINCSQEEFRGYKPTNGANAQLGGAGEEARKDEEDCDGALEEELLAVFRTRRKNEDKSLQYDF